MKRKNQKYKRYFFFIFVLCFDMNNSDSERRYREGHERCWSYEEGVMNYNGAM